MYIKEGPDNKIVLVEIFVYDTLFIENDDLYKEFSKKMNKELDQTLYRSMIGKLQYVVHTRPNIALAVGIVAFSRQNLEKII